MPHDARQIEFRIAQPDPRLLGIKAVQVLFEMVLNRHHHQRFAQIRRLANRFEPRRAHNRATPRHHLQKFFPMQLVKRQRFTDTLFGGRIWLVVETLDWNCRIFFVPTHNIRRETVQHQIDQQIFAIRGLELEELLAQKRW
jgi:hypothetical protein